MGTGRSSMSEGIILPSLPDITKLKELALYIAERSKDDPKFGAVKLNKILYYSDFNSYRELGEPITGATYQHIPEGPAPKEMLLAITELLDSGEAEYEERPYFNQVQKRLVNKREPNRNLFSAKELEMVDEVMKELCHYNATEVSELSKQEWGVRLYDIGEDIPYRTAWLSAAPLTQEQVAKGLELAGV
jgi:hypothetical protein